MQLQEIYFAALLGMFTVVISYEVPAQYSRIILCHYSVLAMLQQQQMRKAYE